MYVEYPRTYLDFTLGVHFTMKRTYPLLALMSLCLPLILSAENPASLKDFTWTLPGELKLGLVHLNDTTTPIIFQPPTLYSIRARAHSNTMFYVQGTPDRNVQMDTTNFSLEQNGETITGVPTSIKHFEKGRVSVSRGDRIEGLLTFDKLADVSQPFTIRHGSDSVQIKFTRDQMKATMPATEAK